MRRIHAASIALLLAGLLPAPASALFHFAHISELHVGTADAPPGAQYVEIEMDLLFQDQVTNSILSAWDCDGDFIGELLTVPGPVPNDGDGVRWIMATTTPLGGMTPDFGTVTASIPTACGQVCWGAPDDTGSVPDPGTWDHTVPNNYVDCVAYGGYTGTTRTLSGTPSPIVPNGGSANLSLTRISTTTGDNATDYALACATPENNAGILGDVIAEPCTETSTTSTTVVTTTTLLPGSTTTTTTPPAAGSDLLPGKKILLKVKADKPDKSSLLILSQKSAETTIGRGEGTPDDPTANGGRLLVASSSPGGGFVGVYTLDSSGWKARRKKGEVSGWGFKDPDGPITSVSIKGGKSIAVKGKGTLTQDLATQPPSVNVVLEIGAHRYCLEFGGTPKFKADKKYLATKAPAPVACADFPT
jgi:hypothetical protein